MNREDELTTAAQMAATWIIDQAYLWNYVEHERVIAHLRARYGDALVATDPQGRTVLGPALRAALRVQGQGHLVWEAALWRWRRRERYDAAWRRAA